MVLEKVGGRARTKRCLANAPEPTGAEPVGSFVSTAVLSRPLRLRRVLNVRPARNRYRCERALRRLIAANPNRTKTAVEGSGISLIATVKQPELSPVQSPTPNGVSSAM